MAGFLPLGECEDCHQSNFDIGHFRDGRTWAMCNECGHDSYTVIDRQSGRVVEASTVDRDVGLAMVSRRLMGGRD